MTFQDERFRDEKDAAKVAINYGDARRGRVELDVLASEVDDLAVRAGRLRSEGVSQGSGLARTFRRFEGSRGIGLLSHAFHRISAAVNPHLDRGDCVLVQAVFQRS